MSNDIRFCQDRFGGKAAIASPLPAVNRVIYVAEGRATIAGDAVSTDQAWFGPAAVASIEAGSGGATLWRWEVVPSGSTDILAQGDDVSSQCALSAPIETLDPGDGSQWLMRCDSVSFPPGGCAYTHVHQGPGIRCLKDGKIRIDAEGHSEHYAPGQPWFESGPDPVFAQADAIEPTRFIRVMVLPRALKGQSSIRYVLDEDKDKPKTQQYRGYVDEFIDL